MDTPILYLILSIVIGVAGLLFLLAKRRKTIISRMIERWAEENNFSVIEYHTIFGNGPHPIFVKGHGQYVCKVEVKDEIGNRRVAWLKLGGYFTGLLRYKIACKWERS